MRATVLSPVSCHQSHSLTGHQIRSLGTKCVLNLIIAISRLGWVSTPVGSLTAPLRGEDWFSPSRPVSGTAAGCVATVCTVECVARCGGTGRHPSPQYQPSCCSGFLHLLLAGGPGCCSPARSATIMKSGHVYPTTGVAASSRLPSVCQAISTILRTQTCYEYESSDPGEDYCVIICKYNVALQSGYMVSTLCGQS